MISVYIRIIHLTWESGEKIIFSPGCGVQVTIKVRVIPVPANPLVLAGTDDLKIIPHRKQGLHPGLITDTVTVGVIFRAAY